MLSIYSIVWLLLLFSFCRTQEEYGPKFTLTVKNMEDMVDKDVDCIKKVLVHLGDILGDDARPMSRVCPDVYHCAPAILCPKLDNFLRRLQGVTHMTQCDEDSLLLAKLLIRRELKSFSAKCENHTSIELIGPKGLDIEHHSDREDHSTDKASTVSIISSLFTFTVLFVIAFR